MTHIDKKIISQQIIHLLSSKATEKPKTILDQIEAAVAEYHPIRHEELLMKARRLVCKKLPAWIGSVHKQILQSTP